MYFGNDVRAGAGREEDGVGHRLAGQLGDDVHRAVADPDHQHALAVEVQRGARVDVVVRVDLGPVEGPGKVRVARIPVVPVAHEQRVEVLPTTVLERDLPAAVRAALGVLHARVEADPLAQRRRRRRSRAATRRCACGADSPDSDRASGSPGRRSTAWRCRCAAIGTPRRRRWGSGSTSCRPTSSDASKQVCGTPKSASALQAVSPLTPAPITHTEGSSPMPGILTPAPRRAPADTWVHSRCAQPELARRACGPPTSEI